MRITPLMGPRENERENLFASEQGIALIATILASMILLALAVLVIALSTQDIRVSAKIVGEKKAYAAAEAGIHALTQSFDPQNLASSSVTGTTVDARSVYTVGVATRPASGPEMIPLAGYAIGGGQQWGQRRYTVEIEGRNTEYDAVAKIEVGIGYGPIEISTMMR